MVETMNKNYRFNKTNNQEIRLRWYSVSLKSGCYCQDAATWVSNKGRMKFARPVYRALFKVEPELARKTFEDNSDFYHPICRALLSDFILFLPSYRRVRLLETDTRNTTCLLLCFDVRRYAPVHIRLSKDLGLS
ncbi:hypothetical protein PGTUg99_004839 [Puccinia graminis f. sp. tritici]|uniref:Peptidase M1 leukotriene A4 hydrolase/aminopeptidase C-terminal domain-containing protein n=1 Tax=Puccinia graminis f. sp. tritici TaxID=56615 RepID=A0A5B0NEQ7_PUCGR|nr:hypothetical protein PGTUg99_004839 [Puccinia graminis f. sp. tritici]